MPKVLKVVPALYKKKNTLFKQVKYNILDSRETISEAFNEINLDIFPIIKKKSYSDATSPPIFFCFLNKP